MLCRSRRTTSSASRNVGGALEAEVKRLLKVVGSLLMLPLLSSTLLAQWPAYSTSGVPKGPDGKPNLSGPIPRTADGKPDLSGIWSNVRAPAGQRGQDAAAAPPPQPPPPAGTPPVATFRDVG